MKRSGRNFDAAAKTRPLDPARSSEAEALDVLSRDLSFDAPRIVAFYWSRFESIRNALEVMMEDSAHVARSDADEIPTAAGALERDRDAASIDCEAVKVRNEFLRGFAHDAGFETARELRTAWRLLQKELECFREAYGSSAVAYESVRRFSVSGSVNDGGEPPMIVDAGPSREPLVHASMWLELIVRPLLIAHRSPLNFFKRIAPEYGRFFFDSARPRETIARWGTAPLHYRTDLRAAFDLLPRSAWKNTLDAAPSRTRRDGPGFSVRVHLRRLDRYEELRQHGYDELTALQEVAEEWSVSETSIRESNAIARRLRKRPPIDHFDFA